MKFLKKGLPIPGKPYLNTSQFDDGMGGYANTVKQLKGDDLGQMQVGMQGGVRGGVQGGMQGGMNNMNNVMGNYY